MEYPNKGTFWYQADKKNEKAPDFKGSVKIDKYYLLQLIEESEGGLVEVKLSGWRNQIDTKNGKKHVISMTVDTNKTETTKPKAKDENEDIPF